MAELSVSYRSPRALKARVRNPRTHSPKQIRQIARSIASFGFTNPILIDRENGIIAGHGRVQAAIQLGIEQVPTICLDDLTDAQVRAYVIADNKLAENAGWDKEILAIEFQELATLYPDLEITVTGFETPEIDLLIGDTADSADDEVLPIDRSAPPTTRRGDVWQIGRHRLICGDATDNEAYEQLLAGDRAQLVFTDPPYNVPVAGHVSGLGRTKHREFAMASGEMDEAAFTEFLATIFGRLVQHSADGSIHYICMDWRHMTEVLNAAERQYTDLKNLCVWAKSNGGMGSLYRSQHELVFVFKTGTAPHINNIDLGRYGRYRTNVWSYAGVNTFGQNRDAEIAMHPTVKPVAMVADAMLDCSHRGGIVLDAFAGSGTTLVAAERVGRCGFGVEIDEHYCDTIIARMHQAFGLEAVHVATGRSYSEIKSERARDPDVSRDSAITAPAEVV